MNDLELFICKNDYMRDLYKEVNYREFYRDIFPVGSFERKNNYSDKKANGIAVIIDDDKYRRKTITDSLEELDLVVDNDFVIFNGIGYFGKERTMRNASLLYAMVFDIDGLNDLNKLINLNSHIDNNINPTPTYIVNSGHGVHLYYVFENPIPLYDHLKEPLRKMKYHLTGRLWNRYVSNIEEVQYQGLNQGFRMVGSPSKLGKNYRLTAFKTGSKINLDYLNSFITDENDKVLITDYQSKLSLDEAKDKYPDWYENKIVKKQKNSSWTVKRDLYDWWIRKIKEGATYGHRYFCIMTLSIYASKCNIPYEELENDAMDLIPFLNSLNPTEPFTAFDVISALNSYDDSYKTFPREDISKITAIDIKPNKRNFRKQDIHLKLARGQLAILRELEEVNEGRPKGSGTKEKIVLDFIEENPNATPTEIAKSLNISRPTVYKYLKKKVTQSV